MFIYLYLNFFVFKVSPIYCILMKIQFLITTYISWAFFQIHITMPHQQHYTTSKIYSQPSDRPHATTQPLICNFKSILYRAFEILILLTYNFSCIPFDLIYVINEKESVSHNRSCCFLGRHRYVRYKLNYLKTKRV